MKVLLDNYEQDTTVNEYITPQVCATCSIYHYLITSLKFIAKLLLTCPEIFLFQEKNEENEFLDAIMATSVIRHLMTFLKEKGKTQNNIDPILSYLRFDPFKFKQRN